MLARPRALLGSLLCLAACGDAGSATETASGATASSSTTSGTTAALPTTSGSATTADPTTTATTTATTTDATSTTGPVTATTTTTTTPDTTTDGTTGEPLDPEACVPSVDGWCWSAPRITGNHLRDVWWDGVGRTWIVGEGGTILHSDGDIWHTVPAAHIEGLRGVWGSGPDDVWVVGDYGLILHWDGAAWSEVASGTTKWLRGVWGSAADDVWAVGDASTLLRWDGQAWSPVATGLGMMDFLSVWGSGPDDVWISAAGFGGPVIHFDGQTWTYRSVDGTGSATGLWGRGPDDVYATLDQGETLHHWTGGPLWIDEDVPPLHPLYAVIGDDGDGLWAGGREGLLAREGGVWQEDPAFPGTIVYGLELAGDDLVGVGTRGVIGRRAGDAWTIDSGDTTTPLGLAFASVGGTAADDIWVSGRLTMHWDGTTWTPVDIDQGVADMVDISVGGDTVWAISLDAEDWLWRHAGDAWEKVVEFPFDGPRALWAEDATHVWIAGDFIGNDIVFWDGQAFTEYDAPGGGQFNRFEGIHGLAHDDVWAVAYGERLVHFDGATWTSIHSEANGDDLTEVWAAGPDDVWTAGNDLHHWDGVTWTDHPGTVWGFNDLWGAASDDVWAVGGLGAGPGVILHWDGATWTRQVSGSGQPIVAVWVDPGGTAWAVGGYHSILAHAP